MVKNGMRPVHPGEILLEEFMKPAEPPINANTLAKALDVPSNRITAIIKGQRGITGDTAVRLEIFFNTTAEFWMNLQKTYELRLAERRITSEDQEAYRAAQRSTRHCLTTGYHPSRLPPIHYPLPYGIACKEAPREAKFSKTNP